MKFVFLRHGETDWNKRKILIGWNDPELNEQGLKQSQAVLHELSHHFDVVYSSPLKRALQVAELIHQHFDIPLIIEGRLKERNFGALSGKTWAQAQSEYGVDFKTIDRRQEYDYRPFGGESASQVKKRVLDFIAWAKREKARSPLVANHGGIIRLLYALSTGGKFPRIKNASLHEFDL